LPIGLKSAFAWFSKTVDSLSFYLLSFSAGRRSSSKH
jgi:hypothetical protein